MWWMGLIQAGVGMAQTAIAASQKTTPMQKYSATPESRMAGQMALQTAERGMAGAQENKFKQDLARQGTAARQMFQNVGLSGAGAAATNIMGIDAINKFAAENANVMRQGRSDYANWAQSMQAISDKNVAQNNQLALMESQAQGGAIQAGIGNIVGGANASSNAMLANKSIDAYGKIAANANSDMSQTLTPTQLGGYGGGNYPAQFQNQTPAPAYQPSQNFYQNFPGAFTPQGGQVNNGMGAPSDWMNQGNWWETPLK